MCGMSLWVFYPVATVRGWWWGRSGDGDGPGQYRGGGVAADATLAAAGARREGAAR